MSFRLLSQLFTLTPRLLPSGSDVILDPTLSTLLSSGIISPPPDDVHDLPRAAG